MKTNSDIQKIISIFNKNRIKILLALFKCREKICGCDLVERIGIPKNLLSYHISFLKKNGLIEEKSYGQKKNYQLSVKGTAFVEEIFKIQKVI